MSRFISNIPISRRLAWAFLLAALIPGLAILGQSFIFSNILNERSQAVQTSVNSLKATMTAESYLQNMNASLNLAYQDQYVSRSAVLQGQTQGIIKNIRTATTQFNATSQQYQQSYQVATSPQMQNIRNILLTDNPDTLLPNKQQQSISLVLNQLWPDYSNAQDRVLQSITANAPKAQVNSLLDQARQKYAPLESEWQQVSQIAEDISNGVAQVGPSQMNPVITSAIIIFLSTVIIISAVGYIIRRTITHPLIELATLTKRIAKGETNARALIDGRDEIHIVANSMNNMLDNIVRLIQETQSQRDTLQGQVEKLVSEVSGVGEGDLRVQAEVTADALGVLADSFNYMVEELGSLVVRVKMVAHEVGNSTTAILDRMTQLVETGDQQINQIAGAVVEVEQMTASSRQVAERAQVLYDVARVARQDAQVGRESVMQAIEGMGRINENVHATASKVQILGERSREINEVVEAISSIAHQTNRLALDAAIQAAMAGENGKGFGAVAADIRRLAERAKDQAGTITRIVRSVREDIGAVAVSMQDTERETAGGARLTQEAGVALESIFAAVEHQAREIENINQVAIQQLQSSSSVVQIMHAISESTQQSSLSTRDASQNMERLARLVEQLRFSVEAFKLRENQNYTGQKLNSNLVIEEEPENPLTVSSVLQTVTTQPVPPISRTGITGVNTPYIEDPFSLYPPGSQPLTNSQTQKTSGNNWGWGPHTYTPEQRGSGQWPSYEEQYDSYNGAGRQ